MKIMNVSLTIDVQNPQQVHALKQLMDALGGNETTSAPVQTPTQQAEDKTAVPVEYPVAAKATRTRKAKVVSDEPKYLEAEEEQAEEEMAQAPGPDPVEKVNLATLRALTANKATWHRAEIKKKLEELGAANVTTIPEDKYSEYHDFITSLSNE